MKVEVKKVDALKRELKFEVPKDRVVAKLDEVYKELSRVAKVKGFRPGKVPRHVLEAEHSSLAKEEMLKKIIPEVYQEGVEKEKLLPLDLPEIQDVDFRDGVVTFKAVVDIKPEVKIDKYKGIKVQRKSTVVTDEDIEKTLDYFKKSTGQDENTPIDDGFAKGLGYPNLEAFKESLSRQMQIDKDRQNRVDIENQIVEGLLKSAKLAVPQSLVKKQLEHRIQDARQRLKSQGLPDEEIDKKEEELRKNLVPQVEKDVKVYLTFDKIAELENIVLKEGENLSSKVMEFLLKEADWQE